MNANEKTETAIMDAFTTWDGITKLPGSVVNVPSGAPSRVAKSRGWTQKCGHRILLTVKGYKEC